MRRLVSTLLTAILLCLTWLPTGSQAEDGRTEKLEQVEQTINGLDKPMYSPFTERYLLDEVRQLRLDQERLRSELMNRYAQTELSMTDRSVRYMTDGVTYFFYLIAGASSILLLVGYNSVRDIKAKAQSLVTEEVNELVNAYESRLKGLEETLRTKSDEISENAEAIEKTQEIHALWLRASQEQNPKNKIAIYDQIMAIRPLDTEALTYKADAALELNQIQWAINLCELALQQNPQHGHAFYQLACAHALQESPDLAMSYLEQAIQQASHYAEDAKDEPLLENLRSSDLYWKLLARHGIERVFMPKS